ncbi:histidinol dehydrogenase-domain-containing protein [Parachaetomium inaequale]|uniref:Histidinol dehydrogenase-domain-containing protein n=1 Tax=Parachaetomium inaequale TaxID=2588326 RepID=A0AAN6PN24_9PEZI|nr:histidinol dehydrogenase-domain-containing protein [Parachaetomium inaequale]
MSPRKSALVTAGSAGVGAAIARVLVLDLGMNVTINYASNAERAESVARGLTEEARVASPENGPPPPTVHAIQADLTDRSEIVRLVEEAAAGPGRLDVVVSNFGWTRMRNFGDLNHGVDEEDWDKCFGANVKAPLWLFHAAKPWLEASNARAAGAAVFVSTASVAGCKPSGSSLAYAVTKAAQIHLVKSLAVIAAPAIRVNSVSPGVLLTDWGLSFPPERLAAVQEANKLGRFATVEDVAEQVKTFVVSRSVTGQNAIIDAGFSLPTGRPTGASYADVPTIVQGVIDSIRSEGDAAVRRYSEKFDSWTPTSFKLSQADIDHAISQVPPQVIADIKTVQASVRTFALAQKESLKEFELEITPGVFLGQKNNPIEAVGARYIPGGRYALLASAHMTILTAKIAGVKRLVACTPPSMGTIPNATVAAVHLAGADDIFILGGVQAVAAMAVGTETVPKVDFIAGPGNAFVAEAKRQLFGEIGIDLFAGPTEVLVVADETADPFMVATDLLSQAEHGPDSPAVLVTTSAAVGSEAIALCDKLLEGLETAAIARVSWNDLGEVVLVESIDEAYAIADEYASEHVQVLTARPRDALDKMQHYGALFLGPMTCVSYGDKVSPPLSFP